MSITLAIATYNRGTYWLDKKLWNAIAHQSKKDFELLIVDDNSTDDTQQVLINYYNENKSIKNKRLIKINLPKDNEMQVCGISDNVIFKEAKGEVLIKCDDDMIINEKLVEYVNNLDFTQPSMYYGNTFFTNPDNIDEIITTDRRWRQCADVPIAVIEQNQIADWGGIWACRTDTIKNIGGHETTIVYNRGVDGLLGWRLRRSGCTMYFVRVPEMKAIHRGVSFFREMANLGLTKELRKKSVSPFIKNYAHDNLPKIIVNGGREFFDNGSWFSNLYEEIKWSN